MIFLTEGHGATFVTTGVLRKYHIFMYFLRKVISHFLPKEKISCFREKKYHLSRKYKRDHVQARPFLKRPSFQKVWRKYPITVNFFWERSSFIFHLMCKIIFSRKRISAFPIIQERSCSSEIFLERPSFQDVWKKKIWFFVQCSYTLLLLHLFITHLVIYFMITM